MNPACIEYMSRLVSIRLIIGYVGCFAIAFMELTTPVSVLAETQQCHCEPPTPGAQLDQTQSVFRARLVSTRLYRSPRGHQDDLEVVQGRYELIEVFEGTPPADSSVLDRIERPGSCALGLRTGLEYIFHVDRYGQVLRCGGSMVYDPLADPTQAILRRYRSLGQGGP